MFSFFLSVLLFLGTVSNAFNITAKDVVPSTPQFSVHSLNRPTDACGSANIEDIVDVNSASEILVWRIGTLAIRDKETSCKVSLAIRYSAGWTYTVTDVSWRAHVVMEPDAKATLSFKATYDRGGATAYSNTWSLADQGPGGPGGFGIWGPPKGDFKTGRDWEDRKQIDERSYVWSPADHISPLNVEWKVAFQSAKSRGMLSVIGDTSTGGKPLALRIGLKFRKL